MPGLPAVRMLAPATSSLSTASARRPLTGPPASAAGAAGRRRTGYPPIRPSSRFTGAFLRRAVVDGTAKHRRLVRGRNEWTPIGRRRSRSNCALPAVPGPRWFHSRPNNWSDRRPPGGTDDPCIVATVPGQHPSLVQSGTAWWKGAAVLSARRPVRVRRIPFRVHAGEDRRPSHESVAA
jgi:hypothetical protein